jgi:hypothetical protein
MAQPEFLGDGHTPRRTDALWAIEQKILGALLDGAGGGGGGTVDNFAGVGSPEGVVTASPGGTYVRTDTSGFWYKVSGSGNTGWSEGIS